MLGTAQYLEISDNSSLASLSGLEALASVTEDFRIASNPALSSLAGLTHLTVALASLLGLSGLTVVQRELAIHSNPALPPCWVSWLEQGLVTLGYLGDTSGSGGEGSCPSR